MRFFVCYVVSFIFFILGIYVLVKVEVLFVIRDWKLFENLSIGSGLGVIVVFILWM